MERTAAQTDCTAASAAAGPTEEQRAWTTPCHHWRYTGRAGKRKKKNGRVSNQCSFAPIPTICRLNMNGTGVYSIAMRGTEKKIRDSKRKEKRIASSPILGLTWIRYGLRRVDLSAER